MRGNASPADAEGSSTIRNVGKHRRADGIAPRGEKGTDQKNGEAAQHPGEEQDEGDVLRRGKGGGSEWGAESEGGKTDPEIRETGRKGGEGIRSPARGATASNCGEGAKQSRTACL